MLNIYTIIYIAIYPPPSLALLITFIRNTIDSYYQAVNDYKELSLKLKDIHNLTTEEINEVIIIILFRFRKI